MTAADAARFVICIDAEEQQDLELWKVYRVWPDAKVSEVDCLRVIDESGEDYLYPSRRFAALELPRKVRDLLLASTGGHSE